MPSYRFGQEHADPGDPSPDDNDSTGDFPPNVLFEYLDSYVDTLQIDESDVEGILQDARSPIIFTQSNEGWVERLRKDTDLMIKPIGEQKDVLYILVAQIEDSDTPSELVEIRSGSVVRFDPESEEDLADKVDFDFVVRTLDNGTIGGITNTTYYVTNYTISTVLAIKERVSVSAIGDWVSDGEEHLTVKRDDLSIIDYHFQDFNPQTRTHSGDDSGHEHSNLDDETDPPELQSKEKGNEGRIADKWQPSTRHITFGGTGVALTLFVVLLVSASLTLPIGILYIGIGTVAFICLFSSILYEDFHRMAKEQ